MKYKSWIGKSQFEQYINSEKIVVAVFAAKWCGFCNRFLQLMDEYSQETFAGDVVVVDADSGDGSIWDQYNIDFVPTIAVYKSGKQIFRRDGKAGAGLGRIDLEEAFQNSYNRKRGGWRNLLGHT